MQFLSERHHQQTRGVIAHLRTAFSFNCRRRATPHNGNYACFPDSLLSFTFSSALCTLLCFYSALCTQDFLLLLLSTFHFLLLCGHSPSTAAAPPLVAAVTPVCRGKPAFFVLLSRLSSPCCIMDISLQHNPLQAQETTGVTTCFTQPAISFSATMRLHNL